MKWFLRLWSYIVHPLFIPSVVSLWYFNYAGYTDASHIRLKVYLILILTIAIPLLIYTMLKIIGAVKSIHLQSTRERITPLIVYAILILILLRSGFKDGLHLQLYCFYLGIFVATLVSLLLTLLKYKISLHMLGMGGAFGFLITLSLMQGIPLLSIMALTAIACGLTATSRLYMKAHVGHELVFGLFLGIASQLLMASYA
ncbi:hypothetical protein [Nonlabens xiamenensis]|uniref:hypothetical protein n=1 Tax=Nonlabens xiamenensis TaxID=2341043 RepID=UPI001F0CC97F|nr:hypothetical protein [Nonlabens xiamenensis]